jgi:putative hydrolase of the HAD superfamily
VRHRAVFFDAGETLVHPIPSFPELFGSVLAQNGYRRTAEEIVQASRVVFQRFSAAAEQRILWTIDPESSRAFWSDVYDRMLETLGLANRDSLRDKLYSTFTDLTNYGLFEDVRPVLTSLAQAGLRLGIVSNFEAWLEDLLAAEGVLDHFGVRAISGVEGIEKPDPEIYRRAIARMDVRPEQAVFVGDNPQFDVDPPAAMGMATVLIDRRGRHSDHPGARIEDLRELPDLLERL